MYVLKKHAQGFKQQLLFVLELDSDFYHKMSLNELQNVTDQISKCGATDSIVIFLYLWPKLLILAIY